MLTIWGGVSRGGCFVQWSVPWLSWDQGKLACNRFSFRTILLKKGMELRCLEVERKQRLMWPGQGSWADKALDQKGDNRPVTEGKEDSVT